MNKSTLAKKKQLFNKGLELFGNEENFTNWLNTENTALGGVKPIELLNKSKGENLVENELIKIEHGILS
ncbi:MAG: MbcA/ParS/Xre antitoxin family protein [Prolixibacteraceae bacterium]|nr:MbcA/ParS/Xre antitoxin family protein [Prolixibacteraceae bacterium]